MFINPILPSVLFHSTNVDLEDLPRSNVMSIIIEMLVDCTFLALYARQVSFATGSLDRKPINHIISSINSCRSTSIRCLSKIKFNPIEENIINHFDRLITSINYGDKVERHIHSLEQIEASLDQSTFDVKLIDDIKRSMRFVLSIANQVDCVEDSITIPYIRIFNKDDLYNKELITLNTSFNLKRELTDGNSPSKLWYRIFSGLRLPNNEKDSSVILQHICFAINVGFVPSIHSGVGLSTFPFETYISSPAIKKLQNESLISFYNKQIILDTIYKNNKSIFSDDNGNVPALEADFSDQVAGEDIDTTNTETTENTDPAATETENTGNEEDQLSTDVAADETSSDPSLTDTQTTDQDESINPSEDGQNNTDITKTKLLGFDVKLAVDETLDTFLYKVAVAKFIDDSVKFNHDDLPTETIMIIKKWKSSLLFLTDAEETKNLFKKLKIRFQ